MGLSSAALLRSLHTAGLVLPAALGLSAYFLFMALLDSGALGGPLLVRYVAGHWISQLTTALGLIGAASLALNAWRVVAQRGRRPPFDPGSLDRTLSDAELAARIRTQLNAAPRATAEDYAVERLAAGLEFIERNGSPDGLDDELKYLADADAQRQADHYALVRILIWATPMFGFLGTVLGISQALGGMDLGSDQDFQRMMDGLRSNLYVAFDTTALALVVSIGLMFVQFGVVRIETNLLAEVDRRVRQLLSHWFPCTAREPDAAVRAVQRIGRSVLAATHEMSQRQAALWRQSIEAAQSAWLQSVQNHYELVQRHLVSTLEVSLGGMAERLAEVAQQIDAAHERRGESWQTQLTDRSRALQESLAAAAGAWRQLAERERSERAAGAAAWSQALADLAAVLERFETRRVSPGDETLGAESDSPARPGVAGRQRLRVVDNKDAAA